MRQESMYHQQPEPAQAENNAAMQEGNAANAFRYLKSLPRNHDRPALDSYKRGRDSNIIDEEIAADFTSAFRSVTETFTIPISWTMTKSALINLLGITSYEGYEEVNGVRFYAGINPDNQLTLIGVSTMAGTGCNEDLTLEEEYPYYDYADPCPTNCSNRGNLKVLGTASLKVVAVQ